MAFGTQPGQDSVSLFGGDSGDQATMLSHKLSRLTMPAGAYAAKAGEMMVVFRSSSGDSYNGVADGFAAEYWCVATDSVGCTDLAAVNFHPAATADDGSCHDCTVCTWGLPNFHRCAHREHDRAPAAQLY